MCCPSLSFSHFTEFIGEPGQEETIVQLLTGSTIENSLQAILCGRSGSMLSFSLTEFLSNRSQYIEVDSYRSKLANVVSGVPEFSVPAVVPPAHCSPLSFLHTGEQALRFSTSVPVEPSPSERVTVVESLNDDLKRVSK